ncbi:hypothetical protein PROFUN_04698 [Planoprotostelium fungivorum]|uniref:Uncharacterized protein n=1 Tax=Planoprotostelium fungivorum TaxID=1890364 RepID=A0A2P6NFX8_9EUKA|nr:hypothetical protein PROFUN_04698 [Planoprotostelium fungivorum]
MNYHEGFLVNFHSNVSHQMDIISGFFSNGSNTSHNGYRYLILGSSSMFSLTCLYIFLSRRKQKGLESLRFARTLAFLSFLCGMTGLCMYSGLGHIKDGRGRDQYYARYLNWSINQPLLVWRLSFLDYSQGHHSLFVRLIGPIFSLITVAFVVLSAFVNQLFYPFYISSVLAGFVTLYMCVVKARKYVPDKLKDSHSLNCLILCFVYTFYGVGFGITDGLSLISVDGTHLYFSAVDTLVLGLMGMLSTAFVVRSE